MANGGLAGAVSANRDTAIEIIIRNDTQRSRDVTICGESVNLIYIIIRVDIIYKSKIIIRNDTQRSRDVTICGEKIDLIYIIIRVNII